MKKGNKSIEVNKQLKLYAIMTTERDLASLRMKGKLKKGTEEQDAYYHGLVKGMTLQLEELGFISVKEVMDKLLVLNPQINSDEFTNPFICEYVRAWYNELNK